MYFLNMRIVIVVDGLQQHPQFFTPSLYSCPFQGSLAVLPIRAGVWVPRPWIRDGLLTCFGPIQNVAGVMVCMFHAQEAWFESFLSAYHHHVNKPGPDESPYQGKPSYSILGHLRPTSSQPNPKHLR